jgi:hypothetical protein
MLLRFRGHVRGNVVAYIALFVSLGGTAAAAIVVSSNAQIGPNTIYGTNAPIGANRNVVADSITGADVRESQLGRVPSATTALNGARRIAYDASRGTGDATVLSLNELTLTARCSYDGRTVVELDAASTIPANINWVQTRQDSYTNQSDTQTGGQVVGSTRTNLLYDANTSVSPSFGRMESQLVYDNAKRVIAVTLHLLANGISQRCQVTGVAVPAPG